MSVSQEEITKALKMLSLIHPDAHNELLVIISKMAREVNELTAEKAQMQNDLTNLRLDMSNLESHLRNTHVHTMQAPKPP